MTSQDEANELLQLYWAAKRNELTFSGMVDEFKMSPEYRAIHDKMFSTMSEESDVTIDQIKDIGHLTSGLKDNARDICDIWNMRPLRRAEFGKTERDEISAVVLGLWTVLRELEKAEAA